MSEDTFIEELRSRFNLKFFHLTRMLKRLNNLSEFIYKIKEYISNLIDSNIYKYILKDIFLGLLFLLVFWIFLLMRVYLPILYPQLKVHFIFIFYLLLYLSSYLYIYRLSARSSDPFYIIPYYRLSGSIVTPFYIVSYYIKRVTTSWTYSI